MNRVHNLSIIIITQNSSLYIARCLESVRWAAEIIVLDSGSTDNTLQLCKEYTDKVYSTDWPGYGPQKNRALQKATKQWVLSLDSDEWLSKSLQEEIKQAIAHNQADAFSIPRRNIYCGKWLRFGEEGNDRLIRLFKRKKGVFKNSRVHEAVVLKSDCKLMKLKQPLWHDSCRSIDQLIDRMNLYSTLSAQSRFEQGKKSNLTKAIMHGLWAFIHPYFFRLGFLDGRMGFIIAKINAQGSYYRHLKLFFKRQKANKNPNPTSHI